MLSAVCQSWDNVVCKFAIINAVKVFFFRKVRIFITSSQYSRLSTLNYEKNMLISPIKSALSDIRSMLEEAKTAEMEKICKLLLLLSMLTPLHVNAQNDAELSAELIGNIGKGDLAPYFITSNVHGIVTQPYTTLLSLDLEKKFEESKRISFGYGVKVLGGYNSKTNYEIFSADTQEKYTRGQSPSSFWLQELYLEMKYRSAFFVAGMKETGSKMLNDRLSSGDMTMSANSRPMPGIDAGFIKPQDIPYTNGWLQISGEIGYFKGTDEKWTEHHYNYYRNFITTDWWFSYKYCYFHTNTEKPFSATFGMQAACQFGGTRYTYIDGMLIEVLDMSPTWKTFARTMIPGSGGNNQGDQNYVEGNHVGSWDLMGRYRFKDGTQLKAYFQKPWEDGSGVGFLNGFDALYGVEYKSPKEKGILTGAVVEYLDLMNQGGSIHWAPADFDETTLGDEATGGDNYYNNYAYNGYQYYGMSIGSPALKSPIYNTDGYMAFTDTRLRSIHVGVEGHPSASFGYRAKFSHTKSWGTIFRPWSKPRKNTSAMLECEYNWQNMPGLTVKGQVAFDRGDIYGDNFGVLLSISYKGLLKF